MARKQKITKENRIAIVALAKEGYSQIAQKYKISKYQVWCSTLSRYRETDFQKWRPIYQVDMPYANQVVR